MSRTSKILGFSVPPTAVKKVEPLARPGCRIQRDRDEDRWVANLIKEAESEAAKKPVTAGQIIAESEHFAREGAKHAEKLGIKTDLRSAVKLIHERRKARRQA